MDSRPRQRRLRCTNDRTRARTRRETPPPAGAARDRRQYITRRRWLRGGAEEVAAFPPSSLPLLAAAPCPAATRLKLKHLAALVTEQVLGRRGCPLRLFHRVHVLWLHLSLRPRALAAHSRHLRAAIQTRRSFGWRVASSVLIVPPRKRAIPLMPAANGAVATANGRPAPAPAKPSGGEAKKARELAKKAAKKQRQKEAKQARAPLRPPHLPTPLLTRREPTPAGEARRGGGGAPP